MFGGTIFIPFQSGFKSIYFMKSIWKGAVEFGLVNIPVRVYSASQHSELNLDLLDKNDQAYIKNQRINATTGKEVPSENIVKGFRYNNEYIILSDEDFETASPKKSRVIEVTEFITKTEIDSIYFESPYYLEPEKSGTKAYALFREVLEKSGKVALASFVLRNKEYLCVLSATGDAIVLNTIRYAEEIRSTEDLNLPRNVKLNPDELEMAMALVEQFSSPFSIEKFKDTYSADLLKLIKLKANGKKVMPHKLKVTHRKPADLMAQLKGTLQKAS
jgi:DNA end-binding protein Ku